MRGNTIEIVLSHGRVGQTRGLFQYDRGQKLLIKGEVPGVYAVHFSNQELGMSKTRIAQGNVVSVPDEYLQSGEDIHLWVYVTGEDHSETEYHGVINVIPRAIPIDMEPEDEDATIIEQAIEALNIATAATSSAMSTIEDTVHSVVQEAIDSGAFDGFTPTITVEQSGEDTTITIIGKDDIQTATIHQNDPLKLFDDNAGDGVKNKVWSADKSFNMIDGKAPRQSPNFSGSVSMGRASGTLVGMGSTAMGNQVTGSGDYSHAEGANTTSSGQNSHAEGLGTIASKANQHAAGKYNVNDTQSGGKYAEIVGNGSSNNERSNARALDWQGNEYLAGNVYVNCDESSGNGSKLQTATDVSTAIAEAIGGVSSFDVQVVFSLPEDKNSHTIYFVPAEDAETRNLYNEFMWINNNWERIGTTEVDLSSKADKADTVLDTTLSRGRNESSTTGTGSFAFGQFVTASGQYSHAEGSQTQATNYYSHAEGDTTKASGQSSHAEGYYTEATANSSHAEGSGSKATNTYSHAEGYSTRANGTASHAEGYSGGDSVVNYVIVYARTDEGHVDELATRIERQLPSANGNYSHSEGYYTASYGNYSHAEGSTTLAFGTYGHAEGYETAAGDTAHAEGYETSAVGSGSHSEGHITLASGSYAHAEGDNTLSKGYATHTEGYKTVAYNAEAHAEGSETKAVGSASHSEGYKTVAANDNSHAEGSETTANGYAAHTEGYKTLAANSQAHAEGQETVASAYNSHAEGYKTGAHGSAAHAEGSQTNASAQNSHAEGSSTTASGAQSHAEGAGTIASGVQAHAEGSGAEASGPNAHAEGGGTHATGYAAHAEGANTYANGDLSHAEGDVTRANGTGSHAEGSNTVANGRYSHVSGQYNVPDNYTSWEEWTANTLYAVGDKVKRTTTQNNETVVKGYICKTANSDSSFTSSKWDEDTYINYAVIVGNGKYNNPSNAYSLDWDGSGHFKGDVYVGCNADGTGGTKLEAITFATDAEIQAIIDAWEVSA